MDIHTETVMGEPGMETWVRMSSGKQDEASWREFLAGMLTAESIGRAVIYILLAIVIILAVFTFLFILWKAILLAIPDFKERLKIFLHSLKCFIQLIFSTSVNFSSRVFRVIAENVMKGFALILHFLKVVFYILFRAVSIFVQQLTIGVMKVIEVNKPWVMFMLNGLRSLCRALWKAVWRTLFTLIPEIIYRLTYPIRITIRFLRDHPEIAEWIHEKLLLPLWVILKELVHLSRRLIYNVTIRPICASVREIRLGLLVLLDIMKAMYRMLRKISSEVYLTVYIFSNHIYKVYLRPAVVWTLKMVEVFLTKVILSVRQLGRKISQAFLHLRDKYWGTTKGGLLYIGKCIKRVLSAVESALLWCCKKVQQMVHLVTTTTRDALTPVIRAFCDFLHLIVDKIIQFANKIRVFLTPKLIMIKDLFLEAIKKLYCTLKLVASEIRAFLIPKLIMIKNCFLWALRKLYSTLRDVWLRIHRFFRSLILDVIPALMMKSSQRIQLIHHLRTNHKEVTHLLDTCILLFIPALLNRREFPTSLEVILLAVPVFLILMFMTPTFRPALEQLYHQSKFPVDLSVALCKLLIIIWVSFTLLSYHRDVGRQILVDA